MGIDSTILRVLEHARASGVSFDRTAMIGRQQLHLPAEEFRRVARSCGWANPDELSDAIFDRFERFAEPLFHAWGATTVDSVDASAYEGANVLTDLNHPVDPSLHRRYSFVLDGGSLEHIFHFPTAIKNCMQMVEVGGHLFSINGTNNFSGHGFYQFSPELMYRILSPENGFEVAEMLVWERCPGSTVFRVRDPKEVGGRVMAQTKSETFLAVIARRTHEAEIFSVTPQQSDYVVDWQGDSRRPTISADELPTLRRWGKQMEKRVRTIKRRCFSRYRPEHYQPLEWRKSA